MNTMQYFPENSSRFGGEFVSWDSPARRTGRTSGNPEGPCNLCHQKRTLYCHVTWSSVLEQGEGSKRKCKQLLP